MKRKLIALILTIATLTTCVFTMTVSATTENIKTKPVVEFVGHQRTVVATDDYGIRLIGIVNDLSPKAVGFDLAIVLEDGRMVTFNKEVTNVHKSILAQVNGEETTITAEELGGEYIFTVVIKDIPANEGFKGFLGSVYYIDADNNKVSGETKKIIYYNADQWKDYGAGERINTTFVEHSLGETPVDAETGENNYFLVDTAATAGESQLKRMWDKDYGNSYGAIKIYGGNVGAYTMAKFDEPTQIGRISFVSWYHANLNNAAKVQVSADGEEWKTIYTFSSETDDTYFLVSGWKKRAISVDVADEGYYEYIRVIADEDVDGDNGFSFSDIAVYNKVMLPGLKQVSVTSPEISITQDAGSNGYYGTGTDGKTEASKANLFDNDKTTSCCVGVWSSTSCSVYVKGDLGKDTVIKKIELTVNDRREEFNKNVKIQASADGTNWDTLYTITEADADFLVKAQNADGKDTYDVYRTFSFAVEGTTTYRYIRVYSENTGNNFALAELKVFEENAYNDTFANLLNTQLPVAK
ncbi:MAG: discoidin domain-containing protein [Clostridia bacterium]|nr:discoidin domain-containing protein [Clostridia bacterium]